MVQRGIAGVLDRRHCAHVQLAGRKEVVELGCGAGHDLSRHTHQPAVYGAVDRITVDPGNPAESHAACTTGNVARPRTEGSGGIPSKLSRTARYKLSRST